MQVEVRLYAGLRPSGPGGHAPLKPSLQEGATVHALLKLLDLPLERVKVVFVNGRQQPPDYVLHEADRVGIFPPAGGG